VSARRNTVRENEPAAALLDDLAKRLACTVAEVALAKESLQPDAKLAARLKALEGKPLTPEGFLELVGSLVNDLPKGVRTIRCTAERDDDGSGVTLRLDLVSAERSRQKQAPKPGTERPTGWNYREHVTLADRVIHGPIGWALQWTGSNLEQSLSAAFGAAPNQSFEIYVELTPQW
jgi:hypothetical protein